MTEVNVNIMDFEYICRVCSVNEMCNLKSIFEERVESQPLKDILMACANIEVIIIICITNFIDFI